VTGQCSLHGVEDHCLWLGPAQPREVGFDCHAWEHIEQPGCGVARPTRHVPRALRNVRLIGRSPPQRIIRSTRGRNAYALRPPGAMDDLARAKRVLRFGTGAPRGAAQPSEPGHRLPPVAVAADHAAHLAALWLYGPDCPNNRTHHDYPFCVARQWVIYCARDPVQLVATAGPPISMPFGAGRSVMLTSRPRC
jgi:hypothetical protein